MAVTRFVLIGGFLGAGKTTTIARLAGAYIAQGHRVGVVTNDQASDLVDTHNLKSQGLNVDEVAGACFCCKFDELTEAIERLERRQAPDIILAEPVGSCTDLVATVIKPIQKLFGNKFEVAPYGVILKPSHGRKILGREAKAGFSPKAAYIFRKQLHEADFVIVNRIDELTAEEIDELAELVSAEVGSVPVIRMSALTGEGFDALLEMLDQRGAFGRRVLDIDYDIYAEGEAELGWLNSHYRIVSERPFELDGLLIGLVEQLKHSLAQAQAETAHVKAIGLCERAHAVANLVCNDLPVELSRASGAQVTSTDLVLNARVAIDPERLKRYANQAVEQACATAGATMQLVQARSLRPGRPVPTYRMS